METHRIPSEASTASGEHRLTRLALIAARSMRGAVSREAGEAALIEVSAAAKRFARVIVRRRNELRRQGGADFIEDAPALIWQRLPKFEQWHERLPAQQRDGAASDLFAAWAVTVLENQYVTLIRRGMARKRGTACALLGSESRDCRPRLAPAPEPLEMDSEVAQRLQRLDPLYATTLFAVSGHWGIVPPTLREQWLTSISGNTGGAGALPSDAIADAPHHKRRGLLAACLGLSRSVFDQRIRRAKQRNGLKGHPANVPVSIHCRHFARAS